MPVEHFQAPLSRMIPETLKKNRVLRGPSEVKFPGTVSSKSPVFLQLPQVSSRNVGLDGRFRTRSLLDSHVVFGLAMRKLDGGEEAKSCLWSFRDFLSAARDRLDLPCVLVPLLVRESVKQQRKSYSRADKLFFCNALVLDLERSLLAMRIFLAQISLLRDEIASMCGAELANEGVESLDTNHPCAQPALACLIFPLPAYHGV